METQGQSLSGKINHLIAIAEDGKLGYENAAKDVNDAPLKELFFRLSGERDGYVTQLQDQLRNYGGEAKGKGGPIGALHRSWINLKSALTSGDRNAIIKECIAGEEYAVKEYSSIVDMIKGDSPLKQILLSQRSGIESALNSIKAQERK